MPAPLDPDKRNAIADAIRAGGTRNQIARDHGVSGATVTSIAKTENLTDAFDRSATKEATAASVVDGALWRRETATRLRRLSGSVLESFESMTAEQWEKVPPYFRMLTFAIAVDKVAELERSEGADTEAAGLVRELMSGLRDAVRADEGRGPGG